ncbi:putative ethanolamine transporter [Escherichia coli]|nr:putative ethanolamine transporter [Escherichia coli]
MGINEIIMYIMMFFMLIAAVDRILSQFGGSARFLGKFGKSIEGSGGQFEEGFMAMGALGLAMVGMTALAPVLAHVLGPVIIPVYEMLGAKPVNVRRNAAGVRYGRLLPRQRAGGRRRSRVAILWVNSRVDDGANDCVFHSGGARHYRTF